MCNRPFMKIYDCFDNIPQVLNSFFDSEMIYFIKIVKKCSTIHILNNKVNIFIFFKKTIKFDNVRVIQSTVQLYLFRKLVDHFILFYFRFYDFLYCCYKTCIMMPNIIIKITLQDKLHQIFLFLILYLFQTRLSFCFSKLSWF